MNTRATRSPRNTGSNLNLRKSAVLRHWQTKSPRMNRVVGLMETMEDWVMDENPEVDRNLQKMGSRVERATPDQILRKSDPLLTVMAYLSSGRSLMMMDWMDTHYNGRVSLRLLDHARQTQDQPTSRLMLERLQTLNSLSLLPEVFSAHRLRFIYQILEDMDGGGGSRDKGRI